AVTTILFVQANKLTTAASAVFLEDASPLCILVLGPWLLRERVHRADLAFLLTVAVGVALCFVGVEPPRATATNPLLGNVLAAVSAVTFALVVIGYRWLTQRPGGSAASVAAAAVSGNVLAFALSLPWMFPVSGHAVDWLIVLYLGTVQLTLCYLVLILPVLAQVAAIRARVAHVVPAVAAVLPQVAAVTPEIAPVLPGVLQVALLDVLPDVLAVLAQVLPVLMNVFRVVPDVPAVAAQLAA